LILARIEDREAEGSEGIGNVVKGFDETSRSLFESLRQRQSENDAFFSNFEQRLRGEVLTVSSALQDRQEKVERQQRELADSMNFTF
jgi:hypothetical protein